MGPPQPVSRSCYRLISRGGGWRRAARSSSQGVTISSTHCILPPAGGLHGMGRCKIPQTWGSRSTSKAIYSKTRSSLVPKPSSSLQLFSAGGEFTRSLRCITSARPGQQPPAPARPRASPFARGNHLAIAPFPADAAVPHHELPPEPRLAAGLLWGRGTHWLASLLTARATDKSKTREKSPTRP